MRCPNLANLLEKRIYVRVYNRLLIAQRFGTESWRKHPSLLLVYDRVARCRDARDPVANVIEIAFHKCLSPLDRMAVDVLIGLCRRKR